MPKSKPARKLSPNALEIKPPTVGPEVHPKSPAKARSANIAVPLPGQCFAAKE